MKTSFALLFLGAVSSTSAFLQHGYCSSFTEDDVWAAATELSCSSVGGTMFGQVCSLNSKSKYNAFVSSCFGKDNDACFAQIGGESPSPPYKCSPSGNCWLGNCS
ncbi:hypothetical protein FE257_003189 [Aspergillus nanangensis]|uniref:Secreted protein n=1 Tax=Aspergillus nanangensis TaxID=2582783 RepID=A0AAD4CBS6_ASPNN|nr:hypothetical protein FE257_003189 [Aspergillus nanangensis]